MTLYDRDNPQHQEYRAQHAAAQERADMMKKRGIFAGTRVNGAALIKVLAPDGNGRVWLPCRLDLRNHSPTGFEWGYPGSGPAQLALAMVAFATGDDRLTLETYQRFKDETVARFPHDGWSLPVADVAAAVARWTEGEA
jgi:hypothetical protein